MILQDRTTREVAEQIGVSYTHLGLCMTGRARPRQEVRDRLPALLGVTLEECFDAELLSKEYGGVRGTNGGRPKLRPATREQDGEDRNDA